MNLAKLGYLARKQWGVITRAQIMAHGGSRSSLCRRLKSGDFVQLEPEAYTFRGGYASWTQRVLAAVVSLGAGSAASHMTAAFLWGLDFERSAPNRVDVTTSRRSSRPLTTAHTHHTRRALTTVLRDGIPTTTLARTLIDLADVLDRHRLYLAFDSARRRSRTFVVELATEIALAGNGRRTRLLSRMVERATGEKPTASPLEARVSLALDQSTLPRPKRQWDIRDPNRKFIAQVDFAWPEYRVVVQCDSHEFHLDPVTFEKDLLQRRRLESHDWRVVHITSQMMKTPEWLEDLERLLTRQQATARASSH
jgi:hypothetical protein